MWCELFLDRECPEYGCGELVVEVGVVNKPLHVLVHSAVLLETDAAVFEQKIFHLGNSLLSGSHVATKLNRTVHNKK